MPTMTGTEKTQRPEETCHTVRGKVTPCKTKSWSKGDRFVTFGLDTNQQGEIGGKKSHNGKGKT